MVDVKIKFSLDTEYNGYNFRSRLEARWAVFFDIVGLDYEYEKEGFNLDGINYLPDFWLPSLQTWVEIKGEKPTEKELKKAYLLSEKTKQKVFLLSGELPYAENKFEFFDYIQNKGNQERFFMKFPPTDEDGGCGCDFPYLFCECPDCGKIGLEFDGRADRLQCKSEGCQKHSPNLDKGYNCYSKKLRYGYNVARSFRFERWKP